MTLLTREAISYYNEYNPDDELIFEEVNQQLKDDLDFAVESLEEELGEIKQRWYEKNRSYTEYLNVPSELISADIFADEVLSQVLVVNKTEKFCFTFSLKNWFIKIFKGAN